MPKVSIIIDTCNSARQQVRAVASAREAGSDVEIVVVDDASTDNTPEICRTLAGIRHARVERSQRLGGARNLGIMVSSGEFITFSVIAVEQPHRPTRTRTQPDGQ